MVPLLDQLRERIAHRDHATDRGKPSGLYPPVTLKDLEKAERALGFSLPPIVQQIYLGIGNGICGPGYGLGLLPSERASINVATIVDLYRSFRESDPNDPSWHWPDQLVPMFHLGCGMFICVDCSNSQGPVFWFEPNPREEGTPPDIYLIPVASSVERWLLDCLNGEDWQGPAWMQWNVNYDLSQTCAICAAQKEVLPHYPNAVCRHCSERVSAHDGRLIILSADELPQRVIARYSDTGELYTDNTYYIDNIACDVYGDKLRGIVIQARERKG